MRISMQINHNRQPGLHKLPSYGKMGTRKSFLVQSFDTSHFLCRAPASVVGTPWTSNVVGILKSVAVNHEKARVALSRNGATLKSASTPNVFQNAALHP